MHDLLNRTGPYLHAPDDVSRLSFETGGTPRVFTLLIAAATESRRADRSVGGIVILDEDEGAVVLDRHLVAEPERQDAEFYRIRGMGWPEFSAFCRSHERFRSRAFDLVDPHDRPLPGSRRRQAALPAPVPLAVRAGELRSDLMIRSRTAPDGTPLFPRTDRSQAIEELTASPLSAGPHGLLMMSWPIRFPELADLSGLQGGRAVDRALDPAWSELIGQRPELIEEARLEALMPVLDGPTHPAGSEQEGRFGLLLCPQGRPELLLSTMDERPISVPDRKALRSLLSGMPDRTIRDLWGLKRSLDHETSPDRLELRFGEALNRIRSALELARDPEPSPAGP
ncbi:hypothetical protein IQ03_01181 [Gemmobacter caeni]|uniref:Uncharacterized protein n=1 Tax=Gemmobacter caeni TaxID=589035 RepID=A0A2T6B936_9RHOB|nr:hypothetical protein [Gemmobacter caeni]PTX52566.1 hypothetical protein C8N34_102346 [Gemmobacter caeni]TWJ02763.1 hypothetical protein IQ03_01181 [Gemmobacter caeni]